MQGHRPRGGGTSRPGPARSGLALALLMALVAWPAAADWLVTLSGDVVETEGPWEVRGKLVVFTLPGGSLSSLRLADVDLEASEEYTEVKDNPPPPPEPEPQEAVLVLTDDDVEHVDDLSSSSMARRKQAAAEARAEKVGSSAAADRGLSVVDWDQTFDEAIDGLVINGRLQNRGRGSRTQLALQVRLLRTDGQLAGRATATVEAPALHAGDSSSFRAVFPGIHSFDRAEFDISSSRLDPRPAEEEEAETEESE